MVYTYTLWSKTVHQQHELIGQSEYTFTGVAPETYLVSIHAGIQEPGNPDSKIGLAYFSETIQVPAADPNTYPHPLGMTINVVAE
jgi:hypothetical protein